MVAAKTATILVIWAYCLFINSLEENFMFMKRLLIILFILTLVTSSSCKSHSLVESLPKLTNENKFWEVIGSLKEAGAEGILIIPIEKMIL